MGHFLLVALKIFLLFIFFKWKKNFFYIYLFLRDRKRQSVNGGGAEREGETESEAGSRLWAVSTEPDAGLKLTNREIVNQAEVGHLTDWATQAPPFESQFQKLEQGGETN